VDTQKERVTHIKEEERIIGLFAAYAHINVSSQGKREVGLRASFWTTQKRIMIHFGVPTNYRRVGCVYIGKYFTVSRDELFPTHLQQQQMA